MKDAGTAGIFGAIIIAAGIYFGLAATSQRFALATSDNQLFRIDHKTGAIAQCFYVEGPTAPNKMECRPASTAGTPNSN